MRTPALLWGIPLAQVVHISAPRYAQSLLAKLCHMGYSGYPVAAPLSTLRDVISINRNLNLRCLVHGASLRQCLPCLTFEVCEMVNVFEGFLADACGPIVCFTSVNTLTIFCSSVSVCSHAIASSAYYNLTTNWILTRPD